MAPISLFELAAIVRSIFILNYIDFYSVST